MSTSCVRPELYFFIMYTIIYLELALFLKMIFPFVSLFATVVKEMSSPPSLLLIVTAKDWAHY